MHRKEIYVSSAEPIKDDNRAAFEAASAACRSKVDTIQAQKVMLELMEVL